MTKVLLSRHIWMYGGGERVLFFAIKSLVKAGFDVSIYTARKPNLKLYEEIIGERFPQNVRVIVGRTSGVRLFDLYNTYLVSRILDPIGSTYDTVVVTQGPLYPWEARGVPLIQYIQDIHVIPSARYVRLPQMSLKLAEDHQEHRVSPLRMAKDLVYKLYLTPIHRLLDRALIYMMGRSFKILFNSKYQLAAVSALTSKREILKKAEILYPPLLQSEKLVGMRKEEKAPCVFTISRFAPDKNLEFILEVARRLKDYKFYIIGGVTKKLRGYYAAIKSAKPQNVYLGMNVPESFKEALLSKCQAYLHPTIWESFGIAPLEAMAAGATLAVPKSSGTWTDICEEKYCYGFSTLDPDQVAEGLRGVLEKPIVAPEEHIEKFSPENFGSRIVKIVEEAVTAGKRGLAAI